MVHLFKFYSDIIYIGFHDDLEKTIIKKGTYQPSSDFQFQLVTEVICDVPSSNLTPCNSDSTRRYSRIIILVSFFWCLMEDTMSSVVRKGAHCNASSTATYSHQQEDALRVRYSIQLGCGGVILVGGIYVLMFMLLSCWYPFLLSSCIDMTASSQTIGGKKLGNCIHLIIKVHQHKNDYSHTATWFLHMPNMNGLSMYATIPCSLFECFMCSGLFSIYIRADTSQQRA